MGTGFHYHQMLMQCRVQSFVMRVTDEGNSAEAFVHRVKIQLNLIPCNRSYFHYHLQQEVINHRNLCDVLGEIEFCERQNMICNDNKVTDEVNDNKFAEHPMRPL